MPASELFQGIRGAGGGGRMGGGGERGIGREEGGKGGGRGGGRGIEASFVYILIVSNSF